MIVYRNSTGADTRVTINPSPIRSSTSHTTYKTYNVFYNNQSSEPIALKTPKKWAGKFPKKFVYKC